MTNQSQPLTLKLSNGQQVSIAQAKSVLQHTENGQQFSCVIVQGPEGTAIYNPEGDVQINGAPSSAHWLQLGDNLQFGNSFSASVEQLGVASEALASLLNETQPTVPTNTVQPDGLPPEISTPAPDTFTPATAATGFTIQPQTAPVAPAASEAATTAEPSTTAADYTVPAATAATLAALGVAAVSGEPSVEPAATPVEPVGFAPMNHSIAEPAAELPNTGFAAELLARIQADDNNIQSNESLNETVGKLPSETTHSPLAADGHSFSPPVDEPTSISSLIPELPSTAAPTPVQEDQPESLEPTTTTTTTTTESAQRQPQSSSVSALLERMKDEGQWGGLSDEAVEEAAAASTPETHETPVLDEADEDVQSYMSQLLSRMRDPNEEQHRQPVSAPAKATPNPTQEQPKAAAAPKPAGLLKPEEYVPKTKARRLDSLQDMRALANSQTRTAIDRSQAKRLETTLGNYNLATAGFSYVAAATIYLFGFFGSLSTAVAVIALIAGGFYCIKAFFAELLESSQKSEPEAQDEPAPTQAPAEPAHDTV